MLAKHQTPFSLSENNQGAWPAPLSPMSLDESSFIPFFQIVSTDTFQRISSKQPFFQYCAVLTTVLFAKKKR